MTKRATAAAERRGIQVIARAAAILRAVECASVTLSLGDLALAVGLARSTVQRIVSALIDEALLMSAGAKGGVALGPELIRMGSAATFDTERLARPLLQELSAGTGETVDLSVLRKGRAVFVDQVIGRARLVALSAVGDAFPLHCTANGKALLSQLPEEYCNRLLRGRLARHTDKTITDRVQLDSQLAQIRRTGLAWDIEEHSLGICAVGAGFVDPAGRHFALSIPVPSSRFSAKRSAMGHAILRVRAAIIKMHSVLQKMPGAL